MMKTLCVLLLSLSVGFLFHKEGFCMKIYTISDEAMKKCTAVAEEYITRTRGWKKEEYRLKFHYIVDEQNAALFGVTHIATHEKVLKEMAKHNFTKIIHDPTDFGLLIDIIDFAVLSENTPDTVFPNAKKKQVP